MQKIFGTNPAPVAKPADPAAPATPTPPGAIPPNADVKDPLVPEGAITDPAVPADNSPLAQFSKLWETKPADPNSPDPAKPAELKAEDVQKIVSQQDFTGMITPEQLTAVTGGGEDAQAALSQVLNAVVQNVMVQSTMVNNKLTQTAVNKAIADERATLPEQLRAGRSRDHLITENPLFDNPAVKPVMEATQKQLLQQYPNATDAELTKMTQDYVKAIAETLAPAPITETTSSGDTDWSNFENS